MEVHVQLGTRSKMFCSCSTDYIGAPPNSNVCPVCLGMPGVLPTINRSAVEQVVKTALALGGEIPRHTKFDRKNYFYPDLPKGYQISQFDMPLSRGGSLDIGGRSIRITRVHLEEDTGKLAHTGDQLDLATESMVDLNRSGMALMEVVTEPDLHSADDARDYAMALREILRYIGASEADMEKGQLRAEANVSVRRTGTVEFGTKTELKNINSFRALHRAVGHEIERQITVLEAGGTIAQETRGWSEPRQETYSQRSKEFAQDYRYFPEPDLPPLELDPAWIDSLRAALPELPAQRRARFQEAHGLSEYDARLLTEDRATADYFEAVVAAGAPAKQAANWLVGERPSLEPGRLAELIRLVVDGTINREQGREVLGAAQSEGRRPGEIVEERGLAQVSGEEELSALIDQIIAANPQAVADFKGGKQQALGALLNELRRLSGGTANMKLASSLLRERLIQ